jgi:transglutaminase-like putative cysteine protease
VLRRETNLEQASLDGRITASRQIDGLQTGDIIDFAYTRTHADPVVKGHSFDAEHIGFSGVAGRYRARVSWPKGEAVQWKASAGFDTPTVSDKDGRTQLELDKTGLLAPKPPVGAPLRFRRVGLLEASSYQSWSEVSKLMAPLYAKASQISKTSPVKAEADAIAAQTKDPKARAFAALRLVEDKTRYFFIGMGDGGYVPANADDTWTRRFGDCKAKTALLLALLKNLGIDAEPELVNLGGGDGLNELVPSLAAFNHVIVRATIKGQTYWLDGTRTGDRSGLDALKPPPHRWGLPVRAEGADLESIVEPPATEPMVETLMQVDASKGLDGPAPLRMTMTFKGAAANAMRATVAKVPKADFDRTFRQQMSNSANGVEITDVDSKDDPEHDSFAIMLGGTMDMDWRKNPDLGMLELKLGSGARVPSYPRREPGPNRDAPFAVPYPSYSRTRNEITLPDAGKGYVVRGPTGTERIGGYELVRSAGLQDGVARFVTDVRSLTLEISAADAEASNVALRRLRDEETLIRAPKSAVGAK